MDDDTATAPTGAPPDLTIDERGMATLRLNRPRHHNRLEPTDIGVIRDLIARVEADPDVRVMLLTASGRSFCAGYDLADLGTPGTVDDTTDGIGSLADTIDRLEACRVPTICALNGPAFGGGTDLALACDFRVGIAACRLMMPAGRFGLHYYHGGLRRYVERLGLAAAKRLFLLGETLDAAAMQAIGYLDEVVADEAALTARTRAMVDTLLAAADPAVIASMKRCLNRIAAGTPDTAAADDAWRRTRRSPAVGTAVAAERARQKTGRGA